MFTRSILFIVDIPRDVFLRDIFVEFKIFFFKQVDLSILVRLRKSIICKIKLLEVRAR